MSNITQAQYWTEVQSLAANIVSEAAKQSDCNTVDTFDRDTVQETIHDTLLATIDDHQWVIYYAYNLDVLQYSDNPNYLVEEFGADDAAEVLRSSGLSGLHTALACWALYADVMERISDELDSYEEALQSDQE